MTLGEGLGRFLPLFSLYTTLTGTTLHRQLGMGRTSYSRAENLV